MRNAEKSTSARVAQLTKTCRLVGYRPVGRFVAQMIGDHSQTLHALGSAAALRNVFTLLEKVSTYTYSLGQGYCTSDQSDLTVDAIDDTLIQQFILKINQNVR